MIILKKVPEYDNYSVSDTGMVMSNKTNKFLKGRVTEKGYLSVILYNAKGSKSFRVHRLILSVFEEKDYSSYHLECGHKDDNKTNNKVENLIWQTRKENMNWNNLTLRIKRVHTFSALRIEKIKETLSKRICRTSKDGVDVFYNSIKDAIAEGFNGGNISACCLGKRRQHKGYFWSHV